ncbi:hypothetical protein KL86CLO1_10976 [uncultured Eubacteriales bacterium]|uniref:HTH luxR-type domain-containing protein n=1 Tax=uncultured Eubacteriales bacterium TaxID=172733 RepID=A0A212JER2_9FIRM|nr:hypothetical protein KL86CLO1_10976 [uncultured Eubacteriales bacterium]
MALFDRLKRMLISEEKRKTSEHPAAKQSAGGQGALPAAGRQRKAAQSGRQVRLSRLTPREHDLYLLLLEGFTLKEAAKQLSIKYSTANSHMSGIYKKLGVNSRAELIINYRGINGEKTQAP